jgi:hypothetical protein
LSEVSPVYIFDRAVGDSVQAEFIDNVAWDDVLAAQVAWSAAMKELVEKLRTNKVPEKYWPQHRHWNWQIKHMMAEVDELRFFGIRHELQMQGFAILKPAALSKLEPQKRLVYVEYIASAPWNLGFPNVTRGRFGQVGGVLMAAAVQLSFDSGFEGRIGLLSLPQSVAWYKEELHMIEVSGTSTDSLRYFEMTQEIANEFLRGKSS